MADMTTTTPPVVVDSAINTCGKPRSVVVDSAMLLSAPSLSVNLEEVKKVKKKTRTLNQGSKDTAAPRKTKKHPVAIPTWPDQGKVLDLCDKLLIDSINRFGDGDHPYPELAKARNLADIINRAVGSRATN